MIVSLLLDGHFKILVKLEFQIKNLKIAFNNIQNHQNNNASVFVQPEFLKA